MTAPPDIADDQPRHARALAGAVAGVLAAAVAIGAAQFAAGLGVPQSSPVLAVGQAAIDLTPPQVKDFAISAFGTDDKTALLGGILVILALYAAVVGMLAVRRLAFGMCGLAIFAAIGLAAALTRPTATAGICGSHPGGGRGRRGRADLAGPRGGQARLSSGAAIPRPARADRPGSASRPGAARRPERPPDPACVAVPTSRAGPAHSFTSDRIRTTKYHPAGPRGGGS